MQNSARIFEDSRSSAKDMQTRGMNGVMGVIKVPGNINGRNIIFHGVVGRREILLVIRKMGRFMQILISAFLNVLI